MTHRKTKTTYTISLLFILTLITLFSVNCGNNDSDDSSDGDYAFQDEGVQLDKMTISLYFPSPSDGLLHPESKNIFNTESITDKAKQTISKLLRGPVTPGLTRIIPPRTKLREIYLDELGTAYVDFSNEFTIGVRGGSDNEILLIYSIVNTLLENFEDIKRVRILVDGREINTLTGHIDLTIPFKSKIDLIYVQRDEDTSGEIDDEEITDDSLSNDDEE